MLNVKWESVSARTDILVMGHHVSRNKVRKYFSLVVSLKRTFCLVSQEESTGPLVGNLKLNLAQTQAWPVSECIQLCLYRTPVI